MPPDDRVPYLGFQSGQQQNTEVLSIDNISCVHYLRMQVLDRPGVVASISSVFGKYQISIEAMIQKEAQGGFED